MKSHAITTLLFAGAAISLHIHNPRAGRVSSIFPSRADSSGISPPNLFLVGSPVEHDSPLSQRDASPAPIPAPAAAPAQAPAYIAMVLSHHNAHRANHSAPKMVYSTALAGYAYTVAASCKFAHNQTPGGGGYGQNIAAIGGSGNFQTQPPRVMAARAITDQWYNGEVNKYLPSYYNKPTPDMSNFGAWGHFSQVVWKGSTNVGCASQYCAPNTIFTGLGSWFTVCNYKVPGNLQGSYNVNVLPSLGMKTIYGQ